MTLGPVLDKDIGINCHDLRSMRLAANSDVCHAAADYMPSRCARKGKILLPYWVRLPCLAAGIGMGPYWGAFLGASLGFLWCFCGFFSGPSEAPSLFSSCLMCADALTRAPTFACLGARAR